MGGRISDLTNKEAFIIKSYIRNFNLIMFVLFTFALIYATYHIEQGDMKPVEPLKEIEDIKPIEEIEHKEPLKKPEKVESIEETEDTTQPKSNENGAEKRNVTPPVSVSDERSNLVKYISKYVDSSKADYYVSLAYQYGGIYKIDPLWLIAMMETESRFRSNAVSSENAIGLMQILPSTARYLGEYNSNNLFNPEVSVKLSAQYLNELERLTGNFRMALIAYNQGIGNVEKGTYRTWYYDKVKAKYDGINAVIR